MGVIRPPWITEEWFAKCPFNYCDHFGDKEVLIEFCKICREEFKFKLSNKEFKDYVYPVKYVSHEKEENVFEKKELSEKRVEKLNSELTDWYDEYEFRPSKEVLLLFNLAKTYGDYVEKTINNLFILPSDSDKILIEKSLDVLLHSKSYIYVKIRRAMSSRQREKENSILYELADSKTSALFAYMAVKRNSQALLALSRHKPLRYLKEKHLKFSALSINLAEMIQKEFFPDEELNHEEVGCDSYYEVFR